MKESVTFICNLTCADQSTINSNCKNCELTQRDKALGGKVNL